MSAVVRALLPAGLERLRDYLQALRGGAQLPPPHGLLTDPDATRELSVEMAVAKQRFATRAQLGDYLWNRLAPLPAAKVEGNRGLWAWLSLFFFDQVCPERQDGTRRPGQDYRHIPDFDFRHRYRHLLYGPYAVYRRHRGDAALVLAGPPHVEPALYQEIAARQDLIVSRGVIEALNLLYLDAARGAPNVALPRSTGPAPCAASSACCNNSTSPTTFTACRARRSSICCRRSSMRGSATGRRCMGRPTRLDALGHPADSIALSDVKPERTRASNQLQLV